jgi:hypothetical protein
MQSGPPSRSGRYGEEKNLDPAGNQTSAAQPIAIPTKYPDYCYLYNVRLNFVLPEVTVEAFPK